MSAVGYAVLPTTISLSGLSKELQKQVLEPTRKAAKQAAETMEKGIGAGAEAAGRAVEKANFRVMKSTQEQEAAESKLAEQKLKTEAANLAVEAAARKRADAETKGVEAVEKAEQELLKKRAAAEKASRDLRTAEAGVEKALSESARAADNLAEKQRLLDAATEDTEESTKGLRERLREVAQEADSTGGMFDGLVGKVGGMATAFAGIAGVGALVAEGMDISGSIDKMNRQLGLTGEAAEMMGDEVTAVMKSGFGTEDAVAAVGSLTSQFAYLGFEGEQTAQELADNFIAFADTFEVDMAEATQTAGQLVKHGLAGDVEHAADLMTTAMQRVPAAMRDELPEIINEYGVNFKNLGYSGEEAFGMLVAQAENGKIALDKTGDALKEFSLFAVDPAKAEVFESIGINATEMANAVAEGGDKAQAKLQETAEKLLAIEDPGLRATTAIELFGTPLEDLGVEGIPSFLEGLSGMESNMAGAAGSSQALADSIGDSLQGRLDTAKNTVMALAGEGFMALWDVMEEKIIPAFQSTVEWVKENESWFGPLAAATGGLALAMGGLATAHKLQSLWAGRAAFSTTTLGKAFGLLVGHPIIMAIAAIAAGLVYFFTQTETGQKLWSEFTSTLSESWDYTVEKVKEGWAWFTDNFFISWDEAVAGMSESWTYTVETVTGWWTAAKGGMLAVWEQLKAGVHEAFERASQRMSDKWSEITTAVASAWTSTKDQFVYVWTVVKATVFDAWNTAVETVRSVFSTVTGALSTSWTWLKDQLHSTWTWVNTNVFDKMKSTLTSVKDSFGTAVEGIRTLWDRVRAAAAAPIRFVVDTVVNRGLIGAWNKVTGWVGLDPVDPVPLGELGNYAHGTSRVPGPRSVGRDNMRFISVDGRHAINLAGQEGIAHQHVVDAIGTHNWDRLNAAAVAGGPQAVRRELGSFAGGGVVGSITGLVNRYFPMMTITSTYRNTNDHHGSGLAVDFSNGTDTTPQMQAAAAWFAQNYGPGLLELIHSPSPYNIKNGKSVGDGFGFYGAGTMNAHRNHVHVAAPAPLGPPGTPPPDLGDLPAGGFFDLGGMVKGLWDKAIGAIGKWSGGGLIGQLPAAFAKAAASKLWDFISEKITLFDTGGVWKHGTAGVNLSGADEYVFTNRAMRDFQLATESLAVAGEEISAAFDGGDWGYGELARYIGEDAAIKILDAASLMGGHVDTLAGAAGELERAFHGGEWAYDSLAYYVGEEAAIKILDAASLMGGYVYTFGGAVDEISEAFRGGDRGYAALSHYLGDDMAKATIAIVSAVGRADRGFREWAAATEEQDRIGTPEEWARHYGAQAGATILDDVLGLFGLGGIVGSPLKASLVDLVNAAADTMNGIHGTRFGHISENALVPAAVLDDQGRAVGTKLVSADSLPEPADTAAAAGGVDATSTTATVTEPPVKEITFEVKGDAVTTEKVSEMFDKLNGELGDTKVRLKKIEDNQTASVISGVSGIV